MYYYIQQGLLLLGIIMTFVVIWPGFDTWPQWLRVTSYFLLCVPTLTGVFMEMRAHRIYQRRKRQQT